MPNNQSLDVANDAFTCQTDGSVAILRLGSKAFDLKTDLDSKWRFLALLSEIERSPELKVLLVINSSDYAGYSEYREFLPVVSGKKTDSTSDGRQLLAREENALGQFALAASSFSKIIAVALQGDITTSFFGTCLACDFRFAASDLRIVSPYADMGAPPVGAFGFYLPRYVGLSKATELLFSADPIAANQALKLGLVNELFDASTLEQDCTDKCREFCRLSNSAIEGTRKLIHAEVEDLGHYMNRSQEIMVKWARSEGRQLA